MKEIKFRARIDNKIVGYEKWYSGHQIEGDPCSAQPCWLYSKDGEYWNPTYIYHKAKDQFTGLKDKNSKEIYEGDIIKFPYTYLDNTSTSGTSTRFDRAIVKFNNLSFEPLEVLRYLVEVIGNIYENPELLERSKNETH